MEIERTEKITGNMTMNDVVAVMSEGNPGAICFISSLFEEEGPEALLQILHCDSIGLRGYKLYMFWNDCCGRDTKKAARALKRLPSNEILEAVGNDIRGKVINI